MKQLDEKSFGEVAEPLKRVTINNLFARAVVERKVNGKIYVNRIIDPDTFYIVHPYGMSLLFGNENDESFNSAFYSYALNLDRQREKEEWLQTFPSGWDRKLTELFGERMIHSDLSEGVDLQGRIEINGRAHFRFNRSKFPGAKKLKPLPGCVVRRSPREVFSKMSGSVVPNNFWNSEDDFYRNGVGFTLFCKDQFVSTAFSSFIHDDKLELGIETIESFRGKGAALLPCAALIEYSLENGFEPIWSCRRENKGSYVLAQKLGFEPVAVTPYYRLSR